MNRKYIFPDGLRSLALAACFAMSGNAAYSQDDLNTCEGMGATDGVFVDAWKGEWGKHTVTGGVESFPVVNYGLNIPQNHRIRSVDEGIVPFIIGEQIPYVPPGKQYSIQLGNTVGKYGYERLTTSFLVTPQNTLIQIQFAVFLFDPGHDPVEQPRFEFKVSDQNQNQIPCGKYLVVSDGNIPGFKNEGKIRYRPWTTASLDLRDYVGQVVTIQFSTFDCSEGASKHFGMALFAIECLSSEITTAKPYCPGIDSTISLKAPAGFQLYHWSTGAADSVVTILHPQAGETYWVKFKPYSSLSDDCELELSYTIPDGGVQFKKDTVPFCEGGHALLEVENKPGYTYQWETGSLASFTEVSAPGDYSVTATDNKGCEYTGFVRAEEIKKPSVSLITENISCAGMTDGRICCVVSNNPFQPVYEWAGFPGQNTPCLENLGAQSCTVTVKEGILGCASAVSATLTGPAALLIKTELLTPPLCPNLPGGEAVVTVAGGTAPYAIQWSHGPEQASAILDLPGNYSVTVTDDHGCTQTASLAAEALDLQVQTVPNNCFHGKEGSITLSGTGGIPPYTYRSGKGLFQDIYLFEDLYAGDYPVEIMDQSGCIVAKTASIADLRDEPLTVNLPGDTMVNLGEPVEITPSSNFLLQKYYWDASAVQSDCFDCPSLSGVPFHNGTVQLTAVDFNGCTDTAFMRIRVAKHRNIYLPNVFKGRNGGASDPADRFFTVYADRRQVEIVKTLQVFSRWGEKLFERTNFMPNEYSEGWDGSQNGTMMLPGVFTYYAVIRFIDGEEIVYSGDVTLIY